jgi:methyltransferase
MVGFPTLFLTFLVIYAVERVAELAYFQRRRVKGQIYDGWSLYLLLASHIGVGCAVAVQVLNPVHSIFLPIAMLGFVGFIGSIALRWWTIAALGPYESAHIEIRQFHPIIAVGPYKYLRHPRYLANVTEVISITVMGNAWLALFLALITYLPLTWLRLIREEAVMSEKLGRAYEAYRAKVSLWPSLKAKG